MGFFRVSAEYFCVVYWMFNHLRPWTVNKFKVLKLKRAFWLKDLKEYFGSSKSLKEQFGSREERVLWPIIQGRFQCRVKVHFCWEMYIISSAQISAKFKFEIGMILVHFEVSILVWKVLTFGAKIRNLLTLF